MLLKNNDTQCIKGASLSKLDRVVSFLEKRYYLFLVIIMALAAFNVFYRIGLLNIAFDEARHGANAYEMLKNKEWIVSTYHYDIDYWNLKPPLSFWAVMLGYSIFGFNPLGLRFFSCVCGLITILLVGLFVKNRYGKLASLIALAVLATNLQIILYHCARGGEADGIYLLFFTTAMLSMLKLKENARYIYLVAFSAAMAFMAKSWHIFAMGAVFVVYLILSRDYKLIKLYKWLVAILIFLMPIFAWGILRYSKDGFEFIKTMIEYDLIKRSANPIEGHTGSIFYYLLRLIIFFGLWFFSLIPGSIAFIRRSLSRLMERRILALLLWTGIPFALYSLAKTKIDWYILPLYPALAIGMGALYAKLLKSVDLKEAKKRLLAWSIVITLLAYQVFIVAFISQTKVEPRQAALREMGQLETYNGYDLYTTSGFFGSKGGWEQPDLLAAELYGDFKTKSGGFLAFISSTEERKMIFAPAGQETDKYVRLFDLKPVASCNGYYLLSR